MKGIKTHAVAVGNAAPVPVLINMATSRLGIALTAEEQVVIASAAGSIAMSFMREVSEGPGLLRRWLGRRAALSKAQLRLVVALIDDRIRKHQGDPR